MKRLEYWSRMSATIGLVYFSLVYLFYGHILHILPCWLAISFIDPECGLLSDSWFHGSGNVKA